tara:strand:- start:369 stop:530 length:162 start_codon:yes stop_codon:yes gene_type:complete
MTYETTALTKTIPSHLGATTAVASWIRMPSSWQIALSDASNARKKRRFGGATR